MPTPDPTPPPTIKRLRRERKLLKQKRPPLTPHIRLAPLHPSLRHRTSQKARRTLLQLVFLHAALSFFFLALLPQRPLSIPTALGLAFAILYYIQLIRMGIQRTQKQRERN